jgi:thiosulfate/3-mercaptopyruvate sulfurtransferase
MRVLTFLFLLLGLACAQDEPRAVAPAPPLVSAQWLREHRGEVILLDIQSSRALYEKGHIPGARYLDFETLRTKEKRLEGQETLAARFGALGIDESTGVVAYDELHGRNAGYVWYALTQLGHPAVSLLDGHIDGFKDELEAGPPPAVAAKAYRPRAEPQVVTGEWVKEHVGMAMLDARPVEQYTGAKPKEGMKGGHIPGAVSVPWDLFTGPDGRYLDEPAARAVLFARVQREIPRDEEIVVYCNSYHQAAHLHFVLDRLGYKNIRAYDASMKEWEKKDWPRATGDQP